MAKLPRIVISNEVELRILAIATEEFHGNVSQYIRVAIYRDLLARDLLKPGEYKILTERSQTNAT